MPLIERMHDAQPQTTDDSTHEPLPSSFSQGNGIAGRKPTQSASAASPAHKNERQGDDRNLSLPRGINVCGGYSVEEGESHVRAELAFEVLAAALLEALLELARALARNLESCADVLQRRGLFGEEALVP